jgi:hypothetical protein
MKMTLNSYLLMELIQFGNALKCRSIGYHKNCGWDQEIIQLTNQDLMFGKHGRKLMILSKIMQEA